MRLCRFQQAGRELIGLYRDQDLIPLTTAAERYEQATGQRLDLPRSSDLLDFLPPQGKGLAAAQTLTAWAEGEGRDAVAEAAVACSDVQLLVPIPRPNKLFLLAGNYAKHIEEGGGVAAERKETFPYVFMKPPTTTLRNPGQAVPLPNVSPEHIDYELELAVILGKPCKGVSEKEAHDAIAGYLVLNDLSDRKFRPNPERKTREKDVFFDWMHGKWHDGFCPCGPCVTSADAIADPQNLKMTLKVNGEVRQDASTAQQIFPVSAVIAFVASFVTLEPGDIISTGTPAGVGASTQTFLRSGDLVEATIEGIGTLATPITAPAE